MALLLWISSGLGFAVLADFNALDTLTLVALALACFMPAVVISLGLLVAAATWSLSYETRHLQGSLDELRQSLLQRDTGTPAGPALSERTQADQQTVHAEAETELAIFVSQRRRAETTGPTASAPEEPEMFTNNESRALGPLPPADDMIRALNFPENEHDAAGFAAMRIALADPRLAPLIQVAQDVLTRLAQEGIYMDDLRPDRARPEFWRAFAQGKRGALIAPLGGIRDRSCLAITSARMRSDPEFRAAVHLFLREFDRVFAQIEPLADDSQITAFSDIRTARAFMLLGRVAGVFSR